MRIGIQSDRSANRRHAHNALKMMRGVTQQDICIFGHWSLSALQVFKTAQGMFNHTQAFNLFRMARRGDMIKTIGVAVEYSRHARHQTPRSGA